MFGLTFKGNLMRIQGLIDYWERAHGSALSANANLLKEIAGLRGEIADLKAERDASKQVGNCPHCGAPVHEDRNADLILAGSRIAGRLIRYTCNCHQIQVEEAEHRKVRTIHMDNMFGKLASSSAAISRKPSKKGK